MPKCLTCGHVLQWLPPPVSGTPSPLPADSRHVAPSHPVPTPSASSTEVTKVARKPLKVAGVIAALLLVTLAIIAYFPKNQKSAPAPPPASLTPSEKLNASTPSVIEVTRATNIDENLFVFYLVEQLYRGLDQLMSQPRASSDFTSGLLGLRQGAEIVSHRVADANLDKSLSVLLSDFVLSTEQHEAFLTKTGRINEDISTRALREKQESGARAGLVAGQYMNTAEYNGATTADALIGGLLLGGLQLWLDADERSKERDAARERLQADALAEFNRSQSPIKANAIATALSLSEKHGWSRGEAEIEFADSDLRRSKTDAQRRSDWQTMVSLLANQVRIKPRNPFLLAEAIEWQIAAKSSQQQNIKPDELMDHVRAMISCAGMVPEHTFYSRYTSGFIHHGARLALRACELESGGRGWIVANSGTGRYAQSLCLTALQFDPEDRAGEIRESLANALAWSGDHQKALSKAVEIYDLRKSSPAFNYNSACMLSIAGKTEDAYKALVTSIRQSSSMVRQARSDRDLEPLRSAKPSELDRLLKIRLTQKVNWGAFYDDLVVTNSSDFALTNLKIRLVATYSSNRVEPELEPIAILPPGQTHSFTNCMSIARGGSIEVTFTCNEQ